MRRPSLVSASLVAVAILLPAGGDVRAQTASTPEDSGSVRGVVEGTFHGGRRLLGFATVQATAGGLARTTAADSLGRYRLDGLPSGPVVLRAGHPGHASVELVVTVLPGGTTDVDLELAARPIALGPVDVTGDRNAPAIDDPDPPAASGRRPLTELEIQTLDLSPGVGQDGLLDAVRNLPGNDPADATDVLFMRGSTTDLKLVLLDGVPVYTPFHVGGLLRTFEPAVLGAADLHVGGAPARFDGGLTHILELRTRRARRDQVRASGSFDLLSASAAVESPLGTRAGVITSARSLHDLGQRALGGARPYGYQDVLVALDADPAPGHQLGATGFWNSEAVLLDYPGAPDDARWANLAGTVSYGRAFEDFRLDFSAGASGYSATLPLQPSADPGDPIPSALFATAGTHRVRAVAEASWGPPGAPKRVGFSHERIDAAFKAVGIEEGQTSESRGRAESTGAFLDLTVPVAPGLTLRGGIRADYFPGSGMKAAPRAAVLWEVAPQALVTVAAGRYHQPTRSPDAEVERTLSAVVDEGLSAADVLPVATADHVVLSLDQRLGERTSLGLDGFWKRYEGLGDTATIRSSGVDVRVLSAGERISGWLGYGLSWFWSGVDLSGRTTDFTGRHLLTAGLAGRLAGPLHAEARFAYGAGLPYTSVPLPAQDELGMTPSPSSTPSRVSAEVASPRRDPLVAGLDQEFLRIDLELQARFEPRWAGRTWTLRPYLRLLNALDRRDALFYTFQPWRSEALTPLAERSFLPLLGLAFSF